MKSLITITGFFLFITMPTHYTSASDHLGWTEYPYATLQARQQSGHAELLSTTAVKTDVGIVVISDFGGKGEYIRCFDTFNDSHQPVGKRVCWRR